MQKDIFKESTFPYASLQPVEHSAISIIPKYIYN